MSVYLNNELIGKYSLDNNQEIVIKDNEIIVEINEGKARFKKNNCKNQLCVKQGWSNNLPIICLPNKLELRFDSNENDKKYIRKIIK